MANKVITKKSTVAGKPPLASDLDIGELAVNTADAKLYTKHSDGTVKQLSAGPTGPTGPTGPINGLRYTFTATNTADTAPNFGAFKFNSTTFASVIWIYISTLDADLNLQSDAIASWDDITGSTSRGILTFQSNSGTKPSAIFRITGTILPGNGYAKIPVQAVSGDVFADGTIVSINFAPTGAKGDAGTNGLNGTAASIAVGTVTTGAPGSAATVTNAGTTSSAILNFSIPQGSTGNTGPSGTVAVGTVTTGVAGSSAAVSNSGTSTAAVLDFTIPKGDKGDQGNTGPAATVAVGTVTTGAAGSSAAVSNSGTSGAAVLDFTIPRGDTGATGSAATVAVGTVTTGAAGSSAAVSNSGTSTAAVFNFTIPKGDTGAQGPSGVTSATAPLSYDSGTQALSTSMATNRLLGRSSAGTGVAQEITPGTNLSLSGGVLSAPAFAAPNEMVGVTTTATATVGSTAVTVASGTGIANGDYVAGPGIVPGTTVSSGGGTTSLTLSNRVVFTLASHPISFYNPSELTSPGISAPGFAKASFLCSQNTATAPWGTITVSRTSGQTTATFTTQFDHGLIVGNRIATATSAIAGISSNTFYEVLTVPTTKTFTITSGSTTAISNQSITLQVGILLAGHNVSSIASTNSGIVWVNFAARIGRLYVPVVTAVTSTGDNVWWQTNNLANALTYATPAAMNIFAYNNASALNSSVSMSGVIF